MKADIIVGRFPPEKKLKRNEFKKSKSHTRALSKAFSAMCLGMLQSVKK